MTGATRRHNRAVTNLVIELGNELRNRPCNVCSTDLSVRVRQSELYTYPGVEETRDEELFHDA